MWIVCVLFCRIENEAEFSKSNPNRKEKESGRKKKRTTITLESFASNRKICLLTKNEPWSGLNGALSEAYRCAYQNLMKIMMKTRHIHARNYSTIRVRTLIISEHILSHSFHFAFEWYPDGFLVGVLCTVHCNLLLHFLSRPPAPYVRLLVLLFSSIVRVFLLVSSLNRLAFACFAFRRLFAFVFDGEKKMCGLS